MALLLRMAWAGCLVSILFLAGCASSDEYRSEQEAGGTLPWNRPASWEGAGPLGSQMNQITR